MYNIFYLLNNTMGKPRSGFKLNSNRKKPVKKEEVKHIKGRIVGQIFPSKDFVIGSDSMLIRDTDVNHPSPLQAKEDKLNNILRYSIDKFNKYEDSPMWGNETAYSLINVLLQRKK